MAHPGFGHVWQQAQMSDVVIMIYDAETPRSENGKVLEPPQSSSYTLLQQFPGHAPILSLSPYFAAQALQWSGLQDAGHRTSSSSDSQSSAPPCTPASSSSSSSSHQVTSPRHSGSKDAARSGDKTQRQIIVLLPDASYEPAAMAVLAGVYVVRTWSELLADLTPQQQVHAAVLADWWELSAAKEAAVGLLQAAVDSADESRGARRVPVIEALLSLAAVPDCLHQLHETAVLSTYGDLEAVWSAAGVSLQESLMRLPLHAVELLLASDKLKVSCEDTVLYTAQAYVNSLAGSSDKAQLAAQKLALLVRCPDLSQFWLVASILSEDADKLLLHGLQPLLKRLLLLRPAGCRSPGGLFIDNHTANVPDSWLLRVRGMDPVSQLRGRSVNWELDVAAIRELAEACADSKKCHHMISPGCLMGGVMWHMQLECSWDASKRGIMVWAFCSTSGTPS